MPPNMVKAARGISIGLSRCLRLIVQGAAAQASMYSGRSLPPLYRLRFRSRDESSSWIAIRPRGFALRAAARASMVVLPTTSWRCGGFGGFGGGGADVFFPFNAFFCAAFASSNRRRSWVYLSSWVRFWPLSLSLIFLTNLPDAIRAWLFPPCRAAT